MAGPGTAEQGAAADGAAPPAGEHKIRALDFAQPTKFTTEIRRRLSGTLTSCCDTLMAVLASELKVEVELDLNEIEQQTWAGARAGLPADSVAVAIRQAGQDAPQLLLSVELSWALQALEGLLGGKAAMAPSARRLTDIDRMLLQGVLDGIVSELSAAWEELGGKPLARGDIDLEGDAGLLVAPGEPTLAVSLSSQIDGAAAGMSLLIPWLAYSPLAESGQGKPVLAHSPNASREAVRLRDSLSTAQVLLRAEIGSVQMPIERMLELEPGAVVELDARAAEGVRMFAEEVSLGRGRPGRSGTRRAVKIEQAGDPTARAATYATLGRAELERARAWAGGERAGERPAVLRSIFIRVWAELGRTHLPLRDAVELAPGAVVELDQPAEDPVELFANGLCFGSGTLVVTPEGSWGVKIAALV